MMDFSGGMECQRITVTVPVRKPAITPAFVVPFQKMDRMDVGPRLAPSPAHANNTSQNTIFLANTPITRLL